MTKKGLAGFCFSVLPMLLTWETLQRQSFRWYDVLSSVCGGLVLGGIIYGIVWGCLVARSKVSGGPVFAPEKAAPSKKASGKPAKARHTSRRGPLSLFIRRTPLHAWVGSWVLVAVVALVLLDWDQEMEAFAEFEKHDLSSGLMIAAFIYTWVTNPVFWLVIIVTALGARSWWRKEQSRP